MIPTCHSSASVRLETKSTSPTSIQRIESGAIALLVIAAFLMLGYAWWWLIALFFVFDVSAIAYLGGPKCDARLYNVGHSYLLPTLMAGACLALAANDLPHEFLAVVSGAWMFHIAVDRALGFGLKLPEAFETTHLGTIGRSATK